MRWACALADERRQHEPQPNSKQRGGNNIKKKKGNCFPRPPLSSLGLCASAAVARWEGERVENENNEPCFVDAENENAVNTHTNCNNYRSAPLSIA